MLCPDMVVSEALRVFPTVWLVGREAIEPRHLLVGISGTDSRGCEILRSAKIDVPMLQAAPGPAFRVVPLEGDAESWEKQLNDAAALGYELAEIVDRRAILRR